MGSMCSIFIQKGKQNLKAKCHIGVCTHFSRGIHNQLDCSLHSARALDMRCCVWTHGNYSSNETSCTYSYVILRENAQHSEQKRSQFCNSAQSSVSSSGTKPIAP